MGREDPAGRGGRDDLQDPGDAGLNGQRRGQGEALLPDALDYDFTR